MHVLDLTALRREPAEEYSNPEPWAVISIADIHGKHFDFKSREACVSSLNLEFSDAPLKMSGVRARGPFKGRAFTPVQARWILRYAKRLIEDRVEYLIVHCEAGISRSPAVCAALDLIWNGRNDYQWFEDYCINSHVYGILLREAWVMYANLDLGKELACQSRD